MAEPAPAPAAQGEGHHGEQEETFSDVGMGTLVLALTLGILARSWLSPRIKLPYTSVVLMLGLVFGFIMHTEEGITGPDIFSRSVNLWINLSPEAILTVILPILIFGSSFSSDLHLFLKQLVPVLTLAGPAVLVNTALLGVTAKYVLPYGWDWPMALLFGSMLSATDPVAVVAILRELGIAESVSILIDGESLLNDGVAIVLFSIFCSLVKQAGEPLPPAETLQHALILCLGGPAIGVVVGAVSSYVLGFILNDPASEITATVLCGYGAYLMAEVLGASGVLSMVAAGLYLSFHGLGRISARVTGSLKSFWSMADYIANTLIFFISGLIMAEKALISASIQGRDWGVLFILYLIVNAARAVGVALFFPVLSRGDYGINLRQATLLAWGGLRGAVSLTLALAVHQQDYIAQDTRDRILFLTAGIVLLTILVNGTTCKHLLNYLGLLKPSRAEHELFIRATNLIETALARAAGELKHDKYLGDADWNVVFRYLPAPTPQIYWHRIQAGHIVLNAEEADTISSYVEAERENIDATTAAISSSVHSTPGDSLFSPAVPAPQPRTATAPSPTPSSGSNATGGSNPAATSALLKQRQQRREKGARGILSLCRRWGLTPGAKYEELPPRLRNRWRRYTALYNEGLERFVHGQRLKLVRAQVYDRLQDPCLLAQASTSTNKAAAVPTPKPQQEANAGQWISEGIRAPPSSTGSAAPSSSPSSVEGAALLPRLVSSKTSSSSGHATPAALHRAVVVQTPQLSRQTSFDGLVPGATQFEPLDFEPFNPSYVTTTQPSATADNAGDAHDRAELATSGSSHDRRREAMANALAEARLRLLTVLKHVYWGSFQSGLLSPEGIRAFERNVALLVANPSKELDEWTTLEQHVSLPLRAVQAGRRWRRLPVVGPVVQSLLFDRLAFFFELAVVFIEAHSNVRIEELFGSGPISKQLALEVDLEVRRAKAALKEFLPVFPDLLNSVKTEIAARFLLHKHRSLLEDAFEAGSINSREYEAMIKEVDSSLVKLYDHTHAETAQPRPGILAQLSFLRFLPQPEREALFGPDSQLCKDVFVRSETCFIQKGSRNLPGWYVVLRGSVLRGYGDGGGSFAAAEDDANPDGGGAYGEEEETVLSPGTVIGFPESLLPDKTLSHSYTAASFVHLLFFDRAAVMAEAERRPQLLRSIWWLIAAKELRRPDGPLGLHGLSLAQLATLLGEERLVNAPAHGGASSTSVGAVSGIWPSSSGSTDAGALSRGGTGGSAAGNASTMYARRPLSLGGSVPSFRTLLSRFGTRTGEEVPQEPAAVKSPASPQEQEGEEERGGTIFGMAKPGSRRHHGGSHGSLEALVRVQEEAEASAAAGPSYGTIGRGGKRGPALAAAAAAALQRLPAHGGAQTLPLPPHHNQPPAPLPPPHPRRRPRQQVVEGDGESHLLLLAGKAEPVGGASVDGGGTAPPAAAVAAPPPAVVPHLKGRWALKRGSVGFLLSEARCQALAQAAAAAAASAASAASAAMGGTGGTGGGGPPMLQPSLSASSSWRAPSNNVRHRRLSSSLSVGSGTALAALAAKATGEQAGAAGGNGAGGDAEGDVEMGLNNNKRV